MLTQFDQVLFVCLYSNVKSPDWQPHTTPRPLGSPRLTTLVPEPGSEALKEPPIFLMDYMHVCTVSELSVWCCAAIFPPRTLALLICSAVVVVAVE